MSKRVVAAGVAVAIVATLVAGLAVTDGETPPPPERPQHLDVQITSDGPAQLNETTTLTVRVRPQRPVRNLTASLVAPSGYEYRPANTSLGTLDADQTRRFRIQVKPCLPINRYLDVEFRGVLAGDEGTGRPFEQRATTKFQPVDTDGDATTKAVGPKDRIPNCGL